MNVRFVLLMVISAEALPAQTVFLPPDVRVRVSAPSLTERLHGRVVSSGEQSIVVATPNADALVTFPIPAIERIDVSRGRNRLAMGALGAGAGLLVGAVIGASALNDDPEGFAALAGLVGGGGVGLITGALLGFAYAPERWSTHYTGSGVTRDSINYTLRPGADVRRTASGQVAVRGEPDRRAGILRGAAVFAGIAVVFGGIDVARDEISSGEYASTILGNAIIGGMVGYLFSPRRWQRLGNTY